MKGCVLCVCFCICVCAHMCMQDINLLSDMACRCFFPYLGCLFIFLRVFPAAQMFLLLQILLSVVVDVPCVLEFRPQSCHQAQLIKTYATFSPS